MISYKIILSPISHEIVYIIGQNNIDCYFLFQKRVADLIYGNMIVNEVLNNITEDDNKK